MGDASIESSLYKSVLTANMRFFTNDKSNEGVV
jgi:hypothetical protein